MATFFATLPTFHKKKDKQSIQFKFNDGTTETVKTAAERKTRKGNLLADTDRLKS
jgi:hypothetical protein